MIPNVRQWKSFGRSAAYTLIITGRRAIFALLTDQILQDAAREAQEKGKAEGQDLMARWGSQLSGHFNFHERYLAMAPEVALAQNSANFALDHAAVRQVKLKQGDDEDPEAELKFEGPAGNLSFKIDDCGRDSVSLLRGVFAERLQT